MNIIAAANKERPSTAKDLIGIKELLQSFYKTYGRSFFTRYDYEEVPSAGADALVKHITTAMTSKSLNGSQHVASNSGAKFTIAGISSFSYTDPIDSSVSSNQGLILDFDDGSRVVWRLSGTGSQGATVRMYVERYLGPEASEEELGRDASEGLKGLIDVALKVSKLGEFLGRDKPTVITVRVLVRLRRQV